MPAIDLNADVGEGLDDSGLIELVSSVNIACGAHAGNETTMRDTVRLAMEAGVAIGAHPGYDDPENFGRKEMHLSEERLHSLITRQLETLSQVVKSLGGSLAHVKPHGAMYNQASVDSSIADTIAEAVARFDPSLTLVGLAGSELIAASKRSGLAVANEAFADRTYRPDGTLTPRSDPRSLVTDPDDAARRAVAIVLEGRTSTVDRTELEIAADTLCVHGDSPDAVAIARRVRERLNEASISILPLSRPI